MLIERPEDDALTAYFSTVYYGPPDPRSGLEKTLTALEILSWPFTLIGGGPRLLAEAILITEGSRSVSANCAEAGVQCGVVVPAGRMPELRQQTIQVLSETINPYLPRIRQIAGAEARVGFRGSLARGTVGNRRKSTFGQPINLDDFDVDAFIVSDELVTRYGNRRWGNQIPELKKIQEEIRVALGELPEFQGLRPGEKGFSFRIFTQEEARRLFGGEEIYFIGN